jgi:hypothetical protein
MAKRKEPSKLLSKVARGLQIANIGKRIGMHSEETAPLIDSDIEEKHPSDYHQEAPLTVKSDVLPNKDSAAHVEPIDELNLINQPAAVSRHLSKQGAEPINSGSDKSIRFSTDSETDVSANIGSSDHFAPNVSLSEPKSAEPNLSHSDEGSATQIESEEGTGYYVIDAIKRNFVSHIDSKINYPPASCEITETKFPSLCRMRLVQNISEEGFPGRFDYVNDNKQQNRNKPWGIITKTSNDRESDPNHSADNTRDEVLPAADHDRTKIEYESDEYRVPVPQKGIERIDQSVIGDERVRSVKKTAEHLLPNGELKIRSAEPETIAHSIDSNIYTRTQATGKISADAAPIANAGKGQSQKQKRLHIGAININVKAKERKVEETWPEAPRYADHVITDDWDWSCRYGR